ncbi:MAG: hypothetical protein PHV74_08640 [Dehalococcoidia bacterium]|nr:hypothetical protein [Dehalococcoidia bacterium]
MDTLNWSFPLMAWSRKVAPVIGLILLLAVLLGLGAVEAAGGVALSGSFSQQAFEIPQGSSVSGPSINVVVFNTGSEYLKVKMTTNAPLGVNIILSEDNFTIPPNGQQQVLAGVEVTQDATPGEYEVSVAAEYYREGVSGIQLAGAASQSAKLVVLGQSALVSVQAVSPEGQPIAATIRLSRVVEGQTREVAYSETGTLEAKVAPGSFNAASFIGGQKVAEENFTVAANDKKVVTLSGATVYFEGFGVVPNTQKDTSKLVFVQIVYTVKNLYQRVDKAEVILEVSVDQAPLEEVSLAELSPLDVGRVGLSYKYIPSNGWVDGTYSYKLRLKLDDKPYATSLAQTLEVKGSGATGNTTTPAVTGTDPVGNEATPVASGDGGGISWALIGEIAAAVVVLCVIGLLLMRRKKIA